MLTHQTLQTLHDLHLRGMAEAYEMKRSCATRRSNRSPSTNAWVCSPIRNGAAGRVGGSPGASRTPSSRSPPRSKTSTTGRRGGWTAP